MFCKYCGKSVKAGDKFCPFCGRKLEEEFLIYRRHKTSDFFKKLISETPEEEIPNYASFGIRLGAFIIDYALILVFAFIIGFFLHSFGLFWPSSFDDIIGFLLIISYHTLFLSLFSSTPGKLLFGLEVVYEATKKRIKFTKALIRSLSYFLSSLAFGIGFLNIIFDKPKHQGWHDKIAKTIVIRKIKKPLIIPLIISIIASIFSSWMIYLTQGKSYDFTYLGKESRVIESIKQRLSKQPVGLCCFYASPNEVKEYLKEIPLGFTFENKKNAEQIFNEFSRAIVTIGKETFSGEFEFGSGFIISPTGLVVTNHHVIEDAQKLAIALTDEDIQIFDVKKIVIADSLKDIAILKIDDANFPFVFLGNSDKTKVGQRVFAIGNPEGFTNTISEGIVSQIREFQTGIKSFQITTPISFGSSGGALFNEYGEVIGITNMIFLEGQNINFAVPINYVKELLGISTFFPAFKKEIEVKLFVMSYCPFALQMEKALLPVWKLFKNKVDFKIYFLDYMMHGEKEMKENLRQYCIQKEENDKFLSYLECFVKKGSDENCIEKTRIDKTRIQTCMEITDELFEISEQFPLYDYPPFDVHKELIEKYDVSRSPTLIINDTEVFVERSPEEIKKIICQSFTFPPPECNIPLSKIIPKPGFGF